MAAISSAPTTFSAIATQSASVRVSIRSSRTGSIPAARAMSGPSVPVKRADQRQAISATTSPAPPQITIRSDGPTDRMSPKSRAVRSTLTSVKSATATSPRGQRAVRQHPQRRVRAVALRRQPQQQQREGQRGRQHHRRHRQRGGQRQRDAQDRAVRGGVPEIGHPAPDHEAAERCRGQSHADARQRGAKQEVVPDHSRRAR